jgi:hypothetical protein
MKSWSVQFEDIILVRKYLLYPWNSEKGTEECKEVDGGGCNWIVYNGKL